MLIGCAIVMVLYLLVNWVFVANLTPAHFGEWISGDHDRITLGHFVMRDLIGGAGAKLMSVFMIVALVAAASAMTMIGPRVYAAMARDGYLPKIFAGKDDGKPPLWSVLLQGAIAIAVAMTTDFIKAISDRRHRADADGRADRARRVQAPVQPRRYKEKPGIAALIARGVFVALVGLDAVLRVHEPAPQHRTFPWIGKVSLPLVWLVFIAVVSAIYAAWVAVRHPGRHA